MSFPRAASSSYFAVPKFSRGDLEEVMKTMRPHDVGDLSYDVPLPFFPFPGERGADSPVSLRDLLESSR
jgi:hypothetical protein